MDCLKCKENIQEYLDGIPARPDGRSGGRSGGFVNQEDISSAKGGSAYGTGLQEKDCIRKDIGRHLEDCVDCRREYQLFKVIDHFLKTQPIETPPLDLPDLVMKKIEQSSFPVSEVSPKAVRKLIIMQKILIPIGAIAALLLMGISLWTATSLFKGSIKTVIEKDFTALVEKVTSFPTIGKGFSFSINNDIKPDRN
ncbi:MAG: hypothetical protein V1871_06275 [Planctomycetota bacterium]